jgi:hypothetical protein
MQAEVLELIEIFHLIKFLYNAQFMQSMLKIIISVIESKPEDNPIKDIAS